MSVDWPLLRREARAMTERSYAPYSGVLVGASGLAEDGRVVHGCNVENASYGVTLCAECGLVSDLASSGGGRLVAVAIVAGDGRPLAPCGRCRQLLYEHGGPGSAGGRRGGRRPHDPRRPAARGLRARRRGDARRPMTPSAVDVIRAKRDGEELPDEWIRWFLDAYTRGTVADEQASALLMAVFFRGLSTRELATWTDAMIRSGERLDLSPVPFPTVDKHSTGGVGDKISLPLCPLVAACGAAVPQLSGRGLGHTGGTLDKLEAIPGFRVDLTGAQFIRQLADLGAVICSAGPDLAPPTASSTRCAT